MTTVNFPSNASTGTIYTFEDRSWIWNGRAWQSKSIFVGYTGSRGYTGSASTVPGVPGANGYTGSQGPAGTSVTIIGSTSTFALLPDPYSGNIGDGYITSDNGYLNVYTGIEWNAVGQIIGYTGSVGYTGSAGASGTIGIDGYTGSQGDIGYTGSQGDTGFVGSQGDTGFTGSIGYTGSQGGFDTQQTISLYTATTYTLTSTDIGKLIALDNTDQIDVLIPDDSVLNFGIGQRFDIVQYNIGPVSVEATGTASVYAPFNAILNEQYAVASIVKIGSNEWIFIGPQAAGYTGSFGDTGYTGSQGDTGYTGSTGDSGYTGSTGGFSSVQDISILSTSTYTLTSTDSGKLLLLENTEEDLITLTVPTNSTVPWAVGQRVDIKQSSDAPIEIVNASGVNVLSSGIPYLFDRNSVATLIKTDTDEWVYVGPQSGYTGSVGNAGAIGYTGSAGALATRDMYTFGGTRTPVSGTDRIPYLRVAANTTCVSASLTARVPPTGGNFVVVIERSSNSGSTFPDTVATVTLLADNVVTNVSTTVSLVAGDLLRLNISSVSGAQDWACQLLTQTT